MTIDPYKDWQRFEEEGEVDPITGESLEPMPTFSTPLAANIQHIVDEAAREYLELEREILSKRKHMMGHHDQSTHGHRAQHEMAKDVAEHGGFTMRNRVHSSVTKGLSLSPYPERGKIMNGLPKQEEVRAWLKQNEDILREPDHYAGGWFDSATGKTFLDISIVVNDPFQARDLCEKHKQRAYYDLEKGEEVRVVAEEEAHG